MSAHGAHHACTTGAILAMFALLAGCTKHSVATMARPARRVVAQTLGPFTSDSTAPGVIRGVVVDDSTGRGVDAAQVFVLRQRRSGRGVGAITDKLGRFQFSFAPFDSLTLVAKRIAYSGAVLPVRLDPSRGYTILLALSPRPVMLCGWPVGPEPAVIVSVRDAVSGRAPANGATVKITAPGYRDSVSKVSTLDDSALVFQLGSFGYFHTYSLVVQSPGFREWRVDDVGDVQVPCGGLVFPIQHVWLLPQ
jgi:hypothetical protein